MRRRVTPWIKNFDQTATLGPENKRNLYKLSQGHWKEKLDSYIFPDLLDLSDLANLANSADPTDLADPADLADPLDLPDL